MAPASSDDLATRTAELDDARTRPTTSSQTEVDRLQTRRRHQGSRSRRDRLRRARREADHGAARRGRPDRAAGRLAVRRWSPRSSPAPAGSGRGRRCGSRCDGADRCRPTARRLRRQLDDVTPARSRRPTAAPTPVAPDRHRSALTAGDPRATVPVVPPDQVTAGGFDVAGSILGNRVLRKEDPKFLTTGGIYVDDLPTSRCWRRGARHVRALVGRPRQDHSASTRRRRSEMPGVIARLTAADLGLAAGAGGRSTRWSRAALLATDKVRFVGEPRRRRRHRDSRTRARTPPSRDRRRTTRSTALVDLEAGDDVDAR